MAGLLPVYERGPITYPVAGSTVVTGGQMVDAVAGGSVAPSAAGSLICLGVALADAIGPSANQNSTDGLGNTVTNLTVIQPYVAVAFSGVYMLTYAANCNFGAYVKTAASGQVTPWIDGTDDVAKIVGRCLQAAGATSGQTGLTQLMPG